MSTVRRVRAQAQRDFTSASCALERDARCVRVGGLRQTPPPEDLKRFVEAASSLDGLKLAELMMAKLVG